MVARLDLRFLCTDKLALRARCHRLIRGVVGKVLDTVHMYCRWLLH